jgi:PAS domain S-box-containing protein
MTSEKSKSNNSNPMARFYLAFGVLIAIMLMIMVGAFTSYSHMANANRWSIHTYKVLVATHGIGEGLSSMEAGARGFAVTGDRSFIPRLTEGQADFSRSFGAAQRLTADNPLQQNRLRAIQAEKQQWLRNYVEPMLVARRAPLDAATIMGNITRISIQGKSHLDVMSTTLTAVNETESVLLQGRSQQSARLQSWTKLILLGGSLFAIGLTVTLCVLLTGNTQRLIQTNAKLAEEIGERAEAETALRETAERLKLVSEVSELGDWELDLVTRKMHRSLRHDQIFGYDEMLPQWNYEIFLQHVHPDDHALVVDAFKRAVTQETEWDFECRIIWQDKSIHWIWERGRVFQTDTDSKRMIGTVSDITPRKEAQAELHALSLRLVESSYMNQRIMDHSLDVICTIDNSGCFLQVSCACEKVWGYTPEELCGRAFIELVVPEDVVMTTQVSADIMAGIPMHNFENRYLHKNGAVVPMVWSAVWSPEDEIVFCVARDNTEGKQAEAQIRSAVNEAERARAEAERANAAKSEFLSRTSHELRTPLNAILGFGQLLEMDDLESRHRMGVEQILKGGRHLLELVNEVLDIATIDAGRLALSCEPVQLHELVQETMELLRPLAAGRGIRLENNIGGGYVLADQQRLKQVLLNLISNAVKFNREGGLVVVASGTAATPGRVRFEVTDTGSGIVSTGLEKLFAPFERLDAPEKGVEGTGIGLTISQRLVSLMDGEIGVYSVENEGTTFWVELPGAQDPMQAVECPRTARAALEPQPQTVGDEALYTVLYIEDNLSNLNLIEHILRRRDKIRLLSAMQGRRGLELAREHRPQLILLDLHLPDMMGDEVLRHLRAESETLDIPVVMLSADATPRQIERLLEAGAATYLTKPLDVKEFMTVLDKTLTNAN